MLENFFFVYFRVSLPINISAYRLFFSSNTLFDFVFPPLVLGDPRVNQNPAFLALGIVFYRWHNIQARLVQEAHPEYIDEDVFQAARRRVIATIQVSQPFL